MKHFHNVRSRCYNLSLSDRQLVELAYQSLIPQIIDQFSPKEFNGLAKLVQKLQAFEGQFQNTEINKYQAARINNSSSSDDECEVDLAEWSRNKKRVL